MMLFESPTLPHKQTTITDHPKIIQACVRARCPRTMPTSAWRGWYRRIAFWTRTFSGRSQQKGFFACRGMFALRLAKNSSWLRTEWSTSSVDNCKLLIFSSLSISQKFPRTPLSWISLWPGVSEHPKLVPSYLLKIPFCLARNKKHRFQAIKKPEIVSRMALFVDVDHPLTDFDQSGHALCSKPQSRTCKSAILIERVAIKSLWKMIKRNSLNLPIIPTERDHNQLWEVVYTQYWHQKELEIVFAACLYGFCLKRSFFLRIPAWPQKLAPPIGSPNKLDQFHFTWARCLKYPPQTLMSRCCEISCHAWKKNTQISHNWWYEKEVKRIKWKRYRRSTNNENDGCFINSDHSVQLLNRTDQINYPIKYYIPLLSTSPSAKSFITSTFIWMNQPALTSIQPNFLKFIQLPFKEQKLEQEKRRQHLNHRGGGMDFFSIKKAAKTADSAPPTHTSLHDPCTRWSEGHELRPGHGARSFYWWIFENSGYIRLIPSHIFSQAGNVNISS